MDITVLNKNFEIIGIVDMYSSFIWTERFQGCGDFELCLLSDTTLMNILSVGNYLSIKNSETMMIIEDIDMTDTITITGRSIISLLERRCIYETYYYENLPILSCTNKMFRNNFYEPYDPKRKIKEITAPWLYLPHDYFIPGNANHDKIPEKFLKFEKYVVDGSFFGYTLLDVVSELSSTNGLGIKMTANTDITSEQKFVFDYIIPEDRTRNQEKNNLVIFSPDFDNFQNGEYFESSKEYKNLAVVIYTDANNLKLSIELGDKSGLERKELWVDANDISPYGSDGNVLPEADHLKLLKQKGLIALSENSYISSFDGEAIASHYSPFKYKKDFNLGDILQLENEYGMQSAVQITEWIISDGPDGYQEYPTFETYLHK